MEFSVKKFDLLQELSLTQGVVERKTTIPILGNILCEASGNHVTLTATDLELSIRTKCEAKVKKEGAGTIPAIPSYPQPIAKIPAYILSSLIARTSYAISNEESRYTLNGALLLLKPENVTMVATDGHRLAVAEIDHKFEG